MLNSKYEQNIVLEIDQYDSYSILLIAFLKEVNVKYILEILSCMEFAVVTFTEKDIS